MTQEATRLRQQKNLRPYHSAFIGKMAEMSSAVTLAHAAPSPQIFHNLMSSFYTISIVTSEDARMAPKPEEVAALQAVFEAELAQKRTQRPRGGNGLEAKTWLIIGLLVGLAAGTARGVVLQADSPFALETLSGDVLFALGLAILAAGPGLCFVGVVRYLVSGKWLSLAYCGAGITIGTLLFGLLAP